MRSTEIESADVYQNDRIVATLTRTTAGCEFRYLDDYQGSGIATGLPNTGSPILSQGDNLPPYFANLLPEGARLMALIARAKTSASDMFSLLIEAGPDCIGNVYVVPQGHSPSVQSAVSKRTLAGLDFGQALAKSMDQGGDGVLAGIQDKLSVSDATIAIPIHTDAAGSAILKLSPPAYPHLVENEAFCLRMAKSRGFAVPRAKIVRDVKGTTGLLVERFDRVRVEKKLHRLHQEDGCQLTNRYPADKYRISLADICRAVGQHATLPIPERLELIRRYAFAYLMGNADMHAKNVSFYSPFGTNDFVQSPLYDVVCTAIYKGLDTRAAMAMDGKDDRFKLGDFIKFAGRFEVSEKALRHAIANLASKFEPWIDQVASLPFEAKAIEQAQNLMASRLADLRKNI